MSASWGWIACCTDGGAIDGLGGDISLEIEFDERTNTEGLIFVDGGSGKRIPLDLSQPFTISTSVPNKGAILKGSGVPGKGIDKAPGLQKKFNPGSKAAESVGKRK